MKKNLFFAIIYLSVIINLILGGIVITQNFFKINTNPTPIYSNYPYLSPRIFTENKNDVIVNFVPLRQALNDYISGLSKPLGVYFEYLPSGVSIGINDSQTYYLASLLKVPVAMGVFKQIELGRIKEDDTFTVQKEDIDPGYGTFWQKGVGTKITVKDALNLMLQQSDNTATNVLFHNIPIGALSDVFNYLDIPQQTDLSNPVVSPKNYSSILRSLYLSSYLTPDSSNEILNILTGSDADNRITQPIPNKIKVAHKIGVHETDDPNQSVYTDCGIIFAPKRPYILCIMTKETTEDHAIKYMQDLSKIVYTYVTNVNQKPK